MENLKCYNDQDFFSGSWCVIFIVSLMWMFTVSFVPLNMLFPKVVFCIMLEASLKEVVYVLIWRFKLIKREKAPENYFSSLIVQFNFRRIISSCFEPHLTAYVELEERTLMENLEKLVQVVWIHKSWLVISRVSFSNTYYIFFSSFW